ncbi:MAG: ABC transporter ATP-binding protein [Roseibium sp.]
MAFWPNKKTDKSAPLCNPDATPYAVFEGVGLTLTGRDILQDISVSFEEHRIGIIGLNGSGKSSFIRMLNGLRQPSVGSLTLFGASSDKAQSELPRHVGFVFQNPDHQAIFPTVEEEIAFSLTQLGMTKEESRAQSLEFLKNHDCDQLAAKPIAELSEGQKQLVCILSVLVMKPSVLVLDEPMTSLDAVASRSIFGKLMALPQRIVMVSHDLSHFESFDRLLWLEDGRIRMDGKSGAVLSAYRKDIDQRIGGHVEVAAL